MHFFKKTLIAITTITALTACKGREDFEKELGYVEPTVSFNQQPIISSVEQFVYADKRGFDDYECDGITDMYSMKDQADWYKTQDFKADFYKGYYDNDGLLTFKSTGNKIDIPFRVEKWVSQYKLDSVKLNSDTCTDMVYTGFTDNYNGRFKMKFAINNTDVGMDNPNKLIPIEQVFDNKNYYDTGIGRIENIFIEFIHTMQSDYHYDTEDSTIYSYLKQDWCDFDGDNTDDFILMWDANDSLSILVAYSEKYGDTGYNQFRDTEHFFIEGFLERRSVSNLDTEDFNGDGVCDIISYRRTRNSIEASLLLKTEDSFLPQKTETLILPESLDLFSSAKKVDTFDRNKDGKADLNFITEQNDKQVIVTYTIQ